MKKFFSLVIPFLMATPALAAFGTPGTQVPVYKSKNSSPYGYYEYTPSDYTDSGTRRFPLVLFLHGLGEEGDGESQLGSVLAHGPSKLIKYGRTFEAVVVSPQSPVWWNASTVDTFVNYLLATYPTIDPSRIYLTGLSMGGGGAWDYATAHPERIAALVPIAGAAGPYAARTKLYGIPLWVFHSFDDGTVSRNESIGNLDTIIPETASVMTGYPYANGSSTAASTDEIMLYSRSGDRHQWYTGATTSDMTADTMIRFTLFRQGGHDSWTRAYNDNNMWNWMFLQKKSGVVTSPIPAPAPSPKPSPSPSPNPVAAVFSSGNVTIDFGSGGSHAVGVNAISDVARGSIADLALSTGARTTADLAVVKGFAGVNLNGTTTPNATVGFDAQTAADSFYGNDVVFNGTTAPSAELEVTNLDPTKAYEFRFFASRMGAGGDNRETAYTVTGTNAGTATLNVAENTANVAVVTGIRPTGTGRIVIDVKKGSRNTNGYGFYYLGGMKITASAPTSSIPAPSPMPTASPSPMPTASPSPSPTPAPSVDVRVDFGGTVGAPSGWNDAHGIARSGSIALKNASGAATGYTLATTAPFNDVNPNGTTTPAAILGLPVAATQDSFFGNDVSWGGAVAPKAVLEIRGLDPSRSYRLEFFASRMGATENRETLYRVTGASTVSVSLDVANNTSSSAKTAGVMPNASGTLVIEIQKGAANRNPYGFYYLGNLRLTN